MLNTLIGGSAALAILYSSWSYVKFILLKLYNIVFISITIEQHKNDDVSISLFNYFNSNSRFKSPNIIVYFTKMYIKKYRRLVMAAAYRINYMPMLVWSGYVPLFIRFIVHDDCGLSFDCFLNTIDGVGNHGGVLLVVTTNNIDKVDEALGVIDDDCNDGSLSTRPGRIDTVLELNPPDVNGRIKIAKRILVDYPEYVDDVVIAGSNDSGAQFQERCTRLALKLFWSKK